MGRIILGQHEYERIADSKPGLVNRETALSRQLRAYVRDGRRVLSFWRAGRSWMFKLMADDR